MQLQNRRCDREKTHKMTRKARKTRKRNVTLYQTVAKLLRRDISRRRQPGDLLQSEAALAERFAVSVITVRQAMEILEREGYVERRQGSGTFVADLKQRRVVAILVELDLAQPGISPFFMGLVQRVQTQLRRAGFRVRLYLGQSAYGHPFEKLTCGEFLDDLTDHHFLGVIGIATMVHACWIDPITAEGIPFVLSGEYPEGAVTIDLQRMSAMGVEWLVRNNRRRIAVIGHDPRFCQHVGSEYGIDNAFAEAGVEMRPDWICLDRETSVAGTGWQAIRDIWAADGEKPDGLLLLDDAYLHDLTLAINELGIAVPEELMIVSHVNRGMTRLPLFPVDRLEVDTEKIAKEIVREAQSQLDGNKPSPLKLAPPKLAPAWQNEDQPLPKPSVAEVQDLT